MKVMIGLGNPGKEYEKTRHNAGFMLLDELRKSWDFPEFELNKKFDAEVSEGNCMLKADSCKLLIAKPQTFMNNSGTAVKKITDFYKLTPDSLVVIHDDLDIELGKYKVSADSRAAGHNGVQNIIDQLGTQKFKRIRVGIGIEVSIEDSNEKCRLGAHDFVLDKFTEEELEKLKKISDNILNEIKKLL